MYGFDLRGAVTTSPYGYRVRVGSQFGTAGASPISAVYARRVLLNNLCHYADVFGQVRASWASGTGKTPISTTTPAAANTPYFLWSTSFPIALRADGSAYKLRIRIAGASSDNATAVRFRAVVGSPLVVSRLVTSATDSAFLTATTTSSTGAWLTGASNGSNAYTTMIEMTPDEVADAIVTVGTPVDIAGADRGVAQALVTLAVYGQTANVASTPQLHGVYAAEWVGN